MSGAEIFAQHGKSGGKRTEYTEDEKMRRLGRALVYLIDVLGADDGAADCTDVENHLQAATNEAGRKPARRASIQ
jgi:hypothetical protein